MHPIILPLVPCLSWGRGGVPQPGQDGGGGTPLDRTMEGVLVTRRVVCLLRSRSRTFLVLF